MNEISTAKPLAPEDIALTDRNNAVKKAILREQASAAMTLHVKGKTTRQIAETLGIFPAAVSQLLKKGYDQNARHMQDLTRREVFVQLSRLDYLFGEVMREWERSCEDSRETRSGSKDTSFGNMAHDETVTRSQIGDPRLAAEARQIMEARLKLLGLNKEETLRVVLEQFSYSTTETKVTIESVHTPQELGEIAAFMKDLGLSQQILGEMPQLPPPAPEPLTDEEAQSIIEAEYKTEAEHKGDDDGSDDGSGVCATDDSEAEPLH
ncbi:hypothetical protein [Janthinobacterium sp.]|uniref:hypothetical protein n=1 Tax=Janthinobacterium sp. TaxID=1871054 RepID=UPI00293D65CD|nr:hypothetical protein [Janthinobacterium sp.]